MSPVRSSSNCWMASGSARRSRVTVSAWSVAPDSRPRAAATRSRTTIWPRAALVLTTQISGPEPWMMAWSTRRVSEAPIVLQTAAVRAPRSLANRMASRVSYVSPDWEIAMTRVSASTWASERNSSELITGMKVRASEEK